MNNISFYRNGFYSNKACLVLIPKNASTAISAFCSWEPCDYTAINRKRYIAVFRDPIDRWISGTTEYLWRSQYIHNQSIENVDLEKIEFDRHTKPQIEFIKTLDLNRTIFYKFDSEVLHRMQKDWGCFRKTVNLEIVNQIKDNADKLKVQEYVLSTLPVLDTKIRQYYLEDFRLTNNTVLL